MMMLKYPISLFVKTFLGFFFYLTTLGKEQMLLQLFLLRNLRYVSLTWLFCKIFTFQNGKQMVQEGALTALASVADSSQVLYMPEFQLAHHY